MRVAVTGATGNVGRSVIDALLRHEHDPVAVVRAQSDVSVLRDLGVEIRVAELLDEDGLQTAFLGCHAVVHTAALLGVGASRRTFEKVNVKGTRTVLRSAAKAGCKRFVFTSSIAVYGMPNEHEVLDEHATRPSGTPYADTKLEAERICFEEGQRLNLDVVVLRAPAIYGPYDRNILPILRKMLTGKLLVYVLPPDVPFPMVRASTFADAIVTALSRPEAFGEAFNVCDSQQMTLREILELVAEETGVSVPSRSKTMRMPMPIARFLEATLRIVGVRPPPFVDLVQARRVLERRPSIPTGKAEQLLGWKPEQDASSALRSSVRPPPMPFTSSQHAA